MIESYLIYLLGNIIKHLLTKSILILMAQSVFGRNWLIVYIATV